MLTGSILKAQASGGDPLQLTRLSGSRSKAELIRRRRGQWRTIEQVELATVE